MSKEERREEEEERRKRSLFLWLGAPLAINVEFLSRESFPPWRTSPPRGRRWPRPSLERERTRCRSCSAGISPRGLRRGAESARPMSAALMAALTISRGRPRRPTRRISGGAPPQVRANDIDVLSLPDLLISQPSLLSFFEEESKNEPR